MTDIPAYERAIASAHDIINDLMRERDILKMALSRIDRHVIGACVYDISDWPEPCEECGEMREIAAQALAKVKE